MIFLRTWTITMLFLLTTTAFAQTSKTEKIKVSGNCGTCKKHIETASRVDGVSSAYWDKATKVLTITYDPAKINADQVQKNVAAAGYDTEKYRGDDKAYNDLDPCCQYQRKTVTALKKHN